MKLLTTPASLERVFAKLLPAHKRLSFAVAWASYGFPGYKQLIKHQKKIVKGIVGIHFYQTDPRFIAKFIKDKRIRFIKKSNGVFHPKFYLFENSVNDWTCLIGSANFTGAAFNTNSEACVLIDAGDDKSGAVKRGLDKTFRHYWDSADYFKDHDLEHYEYFWKLFRQKRRVIAGEFGEKTPARTVLDTPILNASWSEYLQKVLRDKAHRVDERIAVLEAARRLFQRHSQFVRMSPEERQRIAGFVEEDDVHWKWFGSMFGAGTFKKLINAKNQNLSLALDAIPLTGDIRKEHYQEFIELYLRAFPRRERHGLGTATRLLAMKRPDYFVCFDSANRRGLCKAFGISLHRHHYERYWDCLIEQILISKWWNSMRPAEGRASKVWDGRAAFLDSLFYEE